MTERSAKGSFPINYKMGWKNQKEHHLLMFLPQFKSSKKSSIP
jgi:hypothetical protein